MNLLYSPLKTFRTAACAVLLLSAQLPGASAATDPEAVQRTTYLAALTALKAGDDARFQTLLRQERGYVLYPYLQYHYLDAHLAQARDADVQRFLKAQGGSPLSARLRRHYLRRLAADRRWPLFLATYRTADADTGLRCTHWQRLWRDPGARAAVNRRASRFWSSGTPLPDSCTAFYDAWLRRTPERTALVWARAHAAMKQGRLSVALQLRPWLAPADRRWLTRWVAMYRHPVQGLASIDYPVQTQLAREIIRTGVVRLGYRDPAVAMAQWLRLRSRYTFFGEDNNDVLRHLGVLAAENHLPQAVSWLSDAVPRPGDDLRVREWRVRAALWDRDWVRAGAFIQKLPASDQGRPEWRYWAARVAAHEHHEAQAHGLYATLARTRNYYGFLAADRLGLPYSMQPAPVLVRPADLSALAARPAVAAAHELFVLGQIGDARAQWNFATQDLDRGQLLTAAVLARQWGWFDRAIATVNRAGENNDLALRFPVAYRSLVEANAEANGIDPGWIYGVMRQESAFMVDAQSQVGALGLMQLMPGTGLKTAGLINLHLSGVSAILDVANNVRLGARYLKAVLDDNQGDEVLATASYNAGPDRVAVWRPTAQTEPADVWVDTIPYDETRNYVKQVLGFTAVYDYLLQRTGFTLKQHMAAVGPLSN